MSPRKLGIAKDQVWAFRENLQSPLVRALIVNQPEHYYASITIRLLDHPGRGLLNITRVKLPCRWDDVHTYLDAHPAVPRLFAPEETSEPQPASDADPLEYAAKDLFFLGEFTIRRIVREEIDRAIGVPRLALTYQDAAAATGYSASALRMAVDRNELVPSYANSKPVLRIEELHRWLGSLPDEAR